MEVIIGLLPLPAVAISILLMQKIPELWVALVSSCAALCLLSLIFGRRKNSDTLNTFAPLFGLNLLYYISLSSEPNLTALKHTIALSAVTVIIIFYINFGATIVKSQIARFIMFGESIAVAGAGIVGLNVKNFDLGATLYAICICFYILIYTYKNKEMKFYIICLFVSLSSIGILLDFRAMVYLGLLITCTYIALNHIEYSKIRSAIIFFTLVAAMACLFYFYINIDDFEITRALNSYVQEKTGRQLTSGRQKIWPDVLDYALNSPLMGMGASVLPKDFLPTDLSSHNYYLQVFLQSGAIGLGLVVWFLFNIWNLISRLKWTDGRSNFSAAVLLCFMLHNLTEVVLFQNALIVTLPAWIVISLGASEAHPVDGISSQHT